MDARDLPSTDALASALVPDFADVPKPVIVAVVRASLDEARTQIGAGEPANPEQAAKERLSDIAAARPSTVINATGVLLHTNLGRAPMPPAAADALTRFGRSPGNVEVDLRTGRRSSRHAWLGATLPALTGAEAGIAVNNNAGALLLALASVAGTGGRVAVSRGELIEIGGSFRLPELMRASGAELVEVGTTNRTRLSDFEAVADSVDAILKVHPSNYRIEGFQEEVAHEPLAALARTHGIRFIFDVGSGLVDERAPWLGDGPRDWLVGEPGVIQAIDAGADLVLFSGDKLFGGPQAGMIVGSNEAVADAARHPIARAVRLDGGTIAALAATVDLYLERRVLDIPFWSMAAQTVEEINTRATAVRDGLDAVDIVDGESVPGAGSVPGVTIPSRVLRVRGNADAMWEALAAPPRSIVGLRRDGSLLLDLRSVLPDDDHAVRSALVTLVG